MNAKNANRFFETPTEANELVIHEGVGKRINSCT